MLSIALFGIVTPQQAHAGYGENDCVDTYGVEALDRGFFRGQDTYDSDADKPHTLGYIADRRNPNSRSADSAGWRPVCSDRAAEDDAVLAVIRWNERAQRDTVWHYVDTDSSGRHIFSLTSNLDLSEYSDDWLQQSISLGNIITMDDDLNMLHQGNSIAVSDPINASSDLATSESVDIGLDPDELADSVAEASEPEPGNCEDVGGPFSWAVCPIISTLSSGLEIIDSAVQGLLQIDERRYTNRAIQDAWSVMRNIAYLLLVPAMLVMVIGTSLGFEFVSAYTVKKALPRMVAAAIFIAFSFNIAVLAIDITNALGSGIRGIMSTALGAPNPDTLASYFSLPQGLGLETALIFGGGLYLAIGAGGSIPALLLTLLGFVGIAALVLLVAYSVLVLRQIVIVALLIIAPLAIIGWIFPSNTRLWGLWRGVFMKLLLMYPLIMLVLGAGRGLAYIISNSSEGFVESTLFPVFVLLAYVLPYIFIPFAFKFVGGTIGRLSGMVNKAEGGFMRRMGNRGREARENAKAPKKGERQQSQLRAAQRNLYNRRARTDAAKKGARSGGLGGLRGGIAESVGQYQQEDKVSRPKRSDDRAANQEALAAEITKGRADIRGEYAKKQAADIEAQAGAIRAESIYAKNFNANIDSGMSGEEARSTALNAVADQLTQSFKDGTATQSQTTGTMQFLGTQQATKQLHAVQESIGGLSGEAAETANKLYGGALGNAGAYAAVTANSPGMKYIPQGGDTPDRIKEKRVETLLSESPGKSSKAGAAAWGEAYEQDAQRTADKLAQTLSLGGEPAANVKVPQPPSNPSDPKYQEKLDLHNNIKNDLAARGHVI